MVSEGKRDQALAAINWVIIAARKMAYDRRPYEEIADILDIAEYLPLLLVDPADRDEAFREQLVGVAMKYPLAALALERFDKI